MPLTPEEIAAEDKSRRERFLALTQDPDNTMLTIVSHVASGGSLIDLCKMWKLNYGHVIYWINSRDVTKKKYAEALAARDEFRFERIMREFDGIGHSDVRQLFNDDGVMKHPHDWPDEIAQAVAGIEIEELYEGSGKDRREVGQTRKVKLWDKKGALESMAKILGKFVNKTETTVTFKLEDMLTNSYPPEGWVETEGKELKEDEPMI